MTLCYDSTKQSPPQLRVFDSLDILDLPELVTVTQDQVHVFVEGLKGADEDATILQNAPHPEVDVLQHLTALPHRLEKRGHHAISLQSLLQHNLQLIICQVASFSL